MDNPPQQPDTGEPEVPARGRRGPRAARLWRLHAVVEVALRHDLPWAAVAAAVLTIFTLRSPWGVRFGELFEGRIAESDIVAPLDVEIPDEVRTTERAEQSRRAVDDVYVFETKASSRLMGELGQALDWGPMPGSPDPILVATLRKMRGTQAIAAIEQVLATVLSEKIVARRDTLPEGRAVTVRNYGEPGEITLKDFSRIIDLEEAKRRVREGVTGIAALDPALATKAGDWIASLIQPTLTYDLGETRRRMEEAARQVPVLYSRIPKGTTLVHKGAPLTRDAIREIEAVQKASPHGFDATSFTGVLLLVVFLVCFLWRYATNIPDESPQVRRMFPFLVLTLLLHAAIARGGIGIIDLLVKNLDFPFDRPETLWYLIPAASGAVVVTLLTNARIATVYSFFASALLAILFDWNLAYGLYALLTHLAGVYGLTEYRTRTGLMRSGLVIGLAGAAVAAALDAITNGFSPWQVGLTDAVFAFLGGVIGVPLVVSFLLPIFEWLFGVLTDVRLLELSNLDNPLLSELALRAPGSYNHSIFVGTLAEAAAESIGANALFCRVAACYHDIGKMRMPEYYIENQRPGENPHDRLAPSMSALILANHVKEGIRLGREHGLPERILDIIPQHHGTRVMTYFYEKAKAAAAAAGGPAPNPDDYRHPGPKPTTREAAIFMLSDSVEAAARTLTEPTEERFRDMVRQISSRVILDGQFDQCDLTFHDLDKISAAFVRTLSSIYHHRIDYPTFIFDGAAATRRSPRGGRTGGPQEAAGEGSS